MITKQEAAAAWRTLAAYDDERDKPHLADLHRQAADALDPPAPTYPDGMIAWVETRIGGVTTHWLALRSRGAFRVATGEWGKDKELLAGDIVDIRPLRVLADDEIAIDRAAFGIITTAAGARQVALDIEDDYSDTAAAPWRAYADALKAEAGDAK